MAITGKKLTNLTEATSLADNDLMLLESSSVSKKTKWSTVYNAIKSKLVSWLNSLTFSVTTTSKTLPGAINELDKDVGAINSSLESLESEMGTSLESLENGVDEIKNRLRNIIIVDAGAKIINMNGYSNAAIYNIPDTANYFAVVTNGDWSAGEVDIIGTFRTGNQIHIRTNKEYSGNVRVNYAIFKVE